MADEKTNLYLFEALELRSEYEARIQTIKGCLPEARENRERLLFSRDDEHGFLPSSEFDVKEARRQIRDLENKKRRLNSAIQKANFNHHIQFQDETIDLSQALEIRKDLDERIGELHTQVINSSFQRVIYKEDRDIVEPNGLSYKESSKNLEEARLLFRELNKKIRQASFTVQIDFWEQGVKK